jgi:hypothetical protein
MTQALYVHMNNKTIKKKKTGAAALPLSFEQVAKENKGIRG